MLRRLLLAALLATSAAPAFADLCGLGVINSSCTFVTDTSGGTVIFTNPANLSNIGSGVIKPFLGTQNTGQGDSEFGVSTDIPNVNLLPLDDKRDNNNTFTTTFRLNELGTVTIGNTDYYSFFLDINEPNNDPQRLLSLDTLRIWGRTGAEAADPFLATNQNVLSLGDVDLFPNLELVYSLDTIGTDNILLLTYGLFPGSGKGYDMNFLIPVSEFAGLVPDSRIIFGVGYGGLEGTTTGAGAQDGFEEWAYLPAQLQVPEPGMLSLFGLGLLALAWRVRARA